MPNENLRRVHQRKEQKKDLRAVIGTDKNHQLVQVARATEVQQKKQKQKCHSTAKVNRSITPPRLLPKQHILRQMTRCLRLSPECPMPQQMIHQACFDPRQIPWKC